MEARIFHHSEIDAAQWDAFIQASPQGMVYHLHPYLTALAPDWEAVIVTSGVVWNGVFPFHRKSRWGMSYAMQPIFAQYWGICFRQFEAKISKAFESRKEVVNLVIDTLPADLRMLDYHFSPKFDYLAPFTWRGFQIGLRFTLCIDISGSLDEIWGNFADGARRDVRKAEKAGIRVEESDDMAGLIQQYVATRGDKLKDVKPEEYDKLSEAYRQLSPHGTSLILKACDADGRMIGGILFFKFKDTLIYYFGGIIDEYRNSGAMALIVWESIKRFHGQAKIYDFDGSMIEGIERYFRSFGAVPVPYYRVRKVRWPFSWVPSLRQ